MPAQKLLKIGRFLLGGLCVLAVKTALVFINERWLKAPAFLGYLIVHVIILFASYGWHSVITFRVRLGIERFAAFAKAILFVKALDYCIFIGLVYFFHQVQTIAVVVASLFVIVIRYLTMDRLVFGEMGRKTISSIKGESVREFVVSAATLSGNKGAEGMFRAIVQNLQARFPDAKFCLLSYYPKRDRTLNRDSRTVVLSGTPLNLLFIVLPLSLLWAVSRKIGLPVGLIERNRVINALARADVLLDAGGITFVDGREIFLPFNVLTVLPGLLLGTKVVKCAQALGPFQHRLNRLAARLVLPRLSLIVARGLRTQRNLQSIGVTRNVIAGSDLTFSSNPAPSLPEEAQRALGGLEDRPILGVAPSSLVAGRCRKLGIDYSGVVAEFLDRAVRDLALNVVLIPHSARAAARRGRNNDLVVCREILSRTKERTRCALLEEEHDAAHLRTIIGRCRYFATSRFHAMVSALAEKVPVLIFGWRHKYLEVMEEFELEDFVFSYEKLSPDLMLSALEKLLDQEERVRAKLERRLPDVEKRSRLQFDRIAGLLDR
ncbi:polysaccharide pyruvyl transferase family protein [Candidatus Sumerlaeota bacterium]|nr:polysaccharide pyruvyl transferase family protein [Candidatus Sumerlaeota bacterium]